MSLPHGEGLGYRGLYKVGEPYQIRGVWYYPHEDYDYHEIGVASWYGLDFHGKETANGETFDMNDLTAAHRTLPMPSLVHVTNLLNGRSLSIRVNDRGPFINDRIIDLSRRAAKLLGFETLGTTQVSVKILVEKSIALKNQYLRNGMVGNDQKNKAVLLVNKATSREKPSLNAILLPSLLSTETRESSIAMPSVPPVMVAQITARKQTMLGPSGYYIQVAVFSKAIFAHRASRHLKDFGRVRLLLQNTSNGCILYHLYIGPLINPLEVGQRLTQIRKAGYSDALIVKEK